MQLEAYISDLLYRYECVVLPDFGAFLTQYEPAKIHHSTNAFYPPKKVLSFNEQIQKNDGLLVHHVANVEKIPFEAALKKVNKRVKSFKSYLVQGETLTFDNIGDISMNVDGKIEFEPSYHLNYLTDSFGLSQFVSPVISREEYKEKVVVLKETVPLTITPDKRKARPYLRYAAIALIALTIGSFGMSSYYIDQIETHNQLAQEEANRQIESTIQEATFVIENPLPSITLNVNKQTGRYHIVGGAFRIEENSIKKVKQLKKLGYNARAIGVNKYGLHEVVYESFEDRLDALKALRKIRREHNRSAWLLVKDLK